MLGIINERQPTEQELVQLELEELAPDKFDHELQFKISGVIEAVPKKTVNYRPLTREETAKLLAVSRAKDPEVISEPTNLNYHTYSRDEVQWLLQQQSSFKKEVKKEETWDLPKTTVSDTKTASKTKRTKNTKS